MPGDVTGRPVSPPARVAVCVSTHNRSQLLPRLVEALIAQTIGPDALEVVIVDNGSSDDTWATLQELAADAPFALTVLRNQPGLGPAAGRNRAWRAARAPVIAFTDDDCVPTPQWLAAGLAVMERPGRRVAAGVVRAHPDQLESYRPFYYVPLVDSTVAFWFATANAFFARADLETVGGFDEKFRRVAAEDTELAWRIIETGSEPVFVETAVVYHDVRPSTVWQTIRAQSAWADIPAVFRRRPAARRALLYGGIFWKPTHPHLLLLVAASAAVARSRRSPLVLLAVPWLHDWLCVTPRSPDRVLRTAALPGQFLVDVAEIAAMLRGSLRHRTPVL